MARNSSKKGKRKKKEGKRKGHQHPGFMFLSHWPNKISLSGLSHVNGKEEAGLRSSYEQKPSSDRSQKLGFALFLFI